MNSTFGLTEDENYMILDISDDSVLNQQKALTKEEEEILVMLLEKLGKWCYDQGEVLTYVNLEVTREVDSNGKDI